MWEELARQYAGPVAVALVVGYLMRYVEPRSRVVYSFPAWFKFSVPLPDGTTASIWTHALTILNMGWRSATKVEIVHQARPQYFQIQPGAKFTESTNPTGGEHVISIESLARNEVVAVQMLTLTGQWPTLTGVKSADGPARQTTAQESVFIPRSRKLWLTALVIVGFVTVVYWAIRLAARYGALLAAQ